MPFYDREALASLWVQGTLMSIGEGAGIMAALSCQDNCPADRLPEEKLRLALTARKLVL